MTTRLRTFAVILLMMAATYVVCEWSVMQKSGVQAVRSGEVEPVLDVPMGPDPDLAAKLQNLDRIEATFAEYRAARDREVQDLLAMIANLKRQIEVLTAQRTPIEQVAAVPSSRHVRWATDSKPAAVPSALSRSDLAALARAAGFTFVQVRP